MMTRFLSFGKLLNMTKLMGGIQDETKKFSDFLLPLARYLFILEFIQQI